MLRRDFEALWAAEKTIVDDIVFVMAKGKEVLTVDGVEVLGTAFDGLFINLSFECEFGGLTCNFVVKGVGAVHRYCLGGTSHGPAGRFHQHFIEHPSCVRQQLPNVVARNDLRGTNSEEKWRVICDEANITFTGKFFPPEVKCQ